MFHFLLGLIYVPYILFNLSHSFSVLSSFNESCSDNFSCNHPLICSNTATCKCPTERSFWSYAQNTCLSCPPGWIHWENDRCLSLAVPPEAGLTYNQASHNCYALSADIFQMRDIYEFTRFELHVNTLLHSEYSSATRLFFRIGAWINKSIIQELEDFLCDESDKNSDGDECIFIRHQFKNDSLCLSRSQCDESMLFICDMTAMPEYNTTEEENSVDTHRAIGAVIGSVAPLAVNLIGDLLGGANQNPPPQPPPVVNPPPIIIQQGSQGPAPVAPQTASSSSDNTMLFVALGIGAFVLILIILGAVIVTVYFSGCMNNTPSDQSNSYRLSVESGRY